MERLRFETKSSRNVNGTGVHHQMDNLDEINVESSSQQLINTTGKQSNLKTIKMSSSTVSKSGKHQT